MNIILTLAWPPAMRFDTPRRVHELLDQASLPAPASDLIRHVVRTTRLWPREKADVAAELIAHFQDGLAAGRTIDDLIKTFGNPALAADLIRRGKKRNRPLCWRFAHCLSRGFALFVLLYIAAALVLAMRKPQVRVDYLAELNRSLPAAPADQQAWPVYRQALLPHGLLPVIEDIAAMDTDARGHPTGFAVLELRPHDADWHKATAVLRKYSALVDAARHGGQKPVFGLKALPPEEYGAQDRCALGYGDRFTRPTYTDASGPLYSAHWHEMRHPTEWLSYLLSMDSWLAATEGDGARVVENHKAMLGMARQSAERQTFWSLHSSTGICNVANQTLAAIDLAHPRLLNGRRVELLHRMAGAGGLFNPGFAGERMHHLDMIQRTYSDNGCGDGSLTYRGIRTLVNEFASPPRRRWEPPLDEKGVYLASLPAAAMLAVSRKQATQQINDFFERTRLAAHWPMWQRLQDMSEPPRRRNAVLAWYDHYRSLPLTLHLTHAEHGLLRCDEARALHEATMTALALSLYRERHGAYPAALGQLVPRYLPQLPVDHSTGQPLRYKLDDGPLLYGLGKNGIDDGGSAPADLGNWPRVPESADWILYPPRRRQQ